MALPKPETQISGTYPIRHYIGSMYTIYGLLAYLVDNIVIGKLSNVECIQIDL